MFVELFTLRSAEQFTSGGTFPVRFNVWKDIAIQKLRFPKHFKTPPCLWPISVGNGQRLGEGTILKMTARFEMGHCWAMGYYNLQTNNCSI